MSLPDVNLFMFEYWLELAIAAHLTALGVIDPKKQRDDGDLKTPRIEAKTIWNGFAEHRYTNPAGVWFDMGTGKVVLKCVTHRKDTSQSHTRLVGTARFAMQLYVATPGYVPGNPNPATISDRMPYHRIAKMIETGSTPSVTPNQLHDITAMGFDFTMFIRPEKFPQS